MNPLSDKEYKPDDMQKKHHKDIEDLIKGMPKPIVKISGAKRRAANRKSRTKK